MRALVLIDHGRKQEMEPHRGVLNVDRVVHSNSLLQRLQPRFTRRPDASQQLLVAERHSERARETRRAPSSSATLSRPLSPPTPVDLLRLAEHDDVVELRQLSVLHGSPAGLRVGHRGNDLQGCIW